MPGFTKVDYPKTIPSAALGEGAGEPNFQSVLLNMPPTFKETRRGKGKKKPGMRTKYSIKIKTEPLDCYIDGIRLSRNLAENLRDEIGKRIKTKGGQVVATSIKRRQSYERSYARKDNTATNFRFDAPRKKNGEVRKGGVGDTPPQPNETRKYYHSGRLAFGLGIRWDYKKELWRVNAPANRFHRASFGDGFAKFLTEFGADIQPQQALRVAQTKTVFDHVQNLKGQRFDKRVKLAKEFLRVLRLGAGMIT